jgi:hypothetical protein
MLLPPQLSVESHTEIFCCNVIRDMYAVDVDLSLCNPLVCKVDVYRFGLVGLNRK